MNPDAGLFAGLTPLIQVFDMPAALAFYQNVLGFQTVFASPIVDTPEGRFSHFVWLRLGGADLMLNTQYDAGERPVECPASRQLAHDDTGLYIGCTDVDLAHDLLTGRGLIADPPIATPYGLKRFSVRDPDGYCVVFQEIR